METLSVAETAELLGWSVQNVYLKIRYKELPAEKRRHGKSTKLTIKREDIEHLIPQNGKEES